MRVLMSAFACHPGAGSEPGASWTWALAAAEHHEVWLLTDPRSEPTVTAELTKHPNRRLHPIYVEIPLFHGPKWRKTDRVRYILWQLLLPRTIKRLHASVGFDIVHHLTLGADWLPCGTPGLDDVPFVWGPVGGCAPVVPLLWLQVGPALVAGELARLVVTGAGRKVIGEGIARRADVVVTQNRHVADRFRRLAEVIVEPNIALDPVEIEAAHGAPEGEALSGTQRAIFVGRLLPWKGLCLAIKALDRAETANWHLDIIGEGSDRGRAERLVDRLNLSDRVHFHGFLPRSSVLRRLAGADAMLLPSFHDAAGWTVAEALSLGCPVVCIDLTGPGELVAQGDGVKVPPHGDVVGDLARGLASIRGRIAPTRRWDADRAPAVIDGWYQRAVNSHGGEVNRSVGAPAEPASR